MTPREHAEACVQKIHDHVDAESWQIGPVEREVEAAIRAAGAPLAEALRGLLEAAAIFDGDVGLEALTQAQDAAEAALAAWEAK
jgi:hypothetical protein